MTRALSWVCGSRLRQAALLVLIASAIFLPRLGSTGFSQSEGHRVVPAWEMLDDARAGDPHWLEPRMFETSYLRKPPGALWAIAASSAVFGETEFAARLPSAVAAALLALLVWWFATRWFGSPWGLGAGLAQLLLPVTWPSARSAEIESLHLLVTGAVCLALMDLVHASAGTPRRTWRFWALHLVAPLALFIVKGPSGLPFVFATSAALAICDRRVGTGHRVGHVLASVGVIGGVCVLAAGLWRGAVRPGDAPAVTQGVGEFLWDPDRILGTLTVGAAVLFSLMPASIAMLYPWGADAAAERLDATRAEGPTRRLSSDDVARVLALACVISLLIFTALGVSNSRYGVPACALVTPLVAYAARIGWGDGPTIRPARRSSARLAFLFHPIIAVALLLIGAGAYVAMERRDSSGRIPAVDLAGALPDGAEVWADEVIEARPELLMYALREAGTRGVRVRWIKPEFIPDNRPDGLLLLLREDDLEDEVALYTEEGWFGTLTELHRGQVHDYTYVLMSTD